MSYTAVFADQPESVRIVVYESLRGESSRDPNFSRRYDERSSTSHQMSNRSMQSPTTLNRRTCLTRLLCGIQRGRRCVHAYSCTGPNNHTTDGVVISPSVIAVRTSMGLSRYAIGDVWRNQRRRVGRAVALCKGATAMTWQQSWHLDRKRPALLEESGEEEE